MSTASSPYPGFTKVAGVYVPAGREPSLHALSRLLLDLRTANLRPSVAAYGIALLPRGPLAVDLKREPIDPAALASFQYRADELRTVLTDCLSLVGEAPRTLDALEEKARESSFERQMSPQGFLSRLRYLIAYHDPGCFSRMPEGQQAQLRKWLTQYEPITSRGGYRVCLYSAKHWMERQNKLYTTCGQFQGGLIAAGFKIEGGTPITNGFTKLRRKRGCPVPVVRKGREYPCLKPVQMESGMCLYHQRREQWRESPVADC